MTATKYPDEVRVILVDTADRVIGTAEKLAAHRENLLHRAFSIFIFKEDTQELLLQQRAYSKYHSAGLWTNTCCSHPSPGEETITAGERRLQEELGLTVKLRDVGHFHYNAHFSNGLSENELDHVLVGTIKATDPITPNPNEVHAWRWIALKDLREELKNQPEQFTPWFEEALEISLR